MSCPVALLVYETQFLIGPEFAYSARLVDQQALELLLSVLVLGQHPLQLQRLGTDRNSEGIKKRQQTDTQTGGLELNVYGLDLNQRGQHVFEVP